MLRRRRKMINITETTVNGFEAAIRGMRNPMNSWDKSDSLDPVECVCESGSCDECRHSGYCLSGEYVIGENDHDLAWTLSRAGTEHRKYLRMVTVTCDITAPLYWWKEFDTYKVGTVANSCSTMHRIHSKEFSRDDFSCEHMTEETEFVLDTVIESLNMNRKAFNDDKDKNSWWQMIQLLPSSYNQKRTVMLNYEVLANIYRQRKNHKLDEWIHFCRWIELLPYSELITVMPE